MILNENLYGFRTGRSTSLAILDLINYITDEIDERKSTIGVFIYMKKAFDTIDHGIPFKNLHHYGIRGWV